jgi:hypothetical protein
MIKKINTTWKIIKKYVKINFYKPSWLGLIRCWYIDIPEVKNWMRLHIMTPFFSIYINGTLFDD